MKKGNSTKNINTPAYRGVTDPYAKNIGGMKVTGPNRALGSTAVKQTGISTGNVSGRGLSAKALAQAIRGVPLSQVGENPTVHSKNTKRYGIDGSKGPQGSTGDSPTKPYSSSPTDHTPTPVRHIAPQASKEPTRVGFVDGKFVTPKYGK